MNQYKTIVLSARYPHIRYETIDYLATIDDILKKSLVSFDHQLDEVKISGFKVFDYKNSELSKMVKNPNWLNLQTPNVNLLRTDLKDCLSLSNDNFLVNKDLATEITDKIINQNNANSKMEILNFLYDKYYKDINNVNTKTPKSQNHALATFYVYFNEYLNLNIDFEEWSEEYLNFKPVQFLQINEMEQIRQGILTDFKVNNIDYAIENMKYLREVGYTELSNNVNSDNYSFSDLQEQVNNFNQLYDLNIFKERYFGIKNEVSIDIENDYLGYIDFLETNYETIQKASIYEVLNNRGTFVDYSELEIDTLLDVLYSEFQTTDYLSIVDYDFIDNTVSGIVNSFEQANEIGLEDVDYDNAKVKNRNEVEM